MTILGIPLERAAGSFGWGNLIDFVHHLPQTSAVFRQRNADASAFGSDLKRNAILADIFDAIAGFNYSFSKAYGGKGKKPVPYERPWLDNGVQRIGSDPIPISEFNKWYYGGE